LESRQNENGLSGTATDAEQLRATNCLTMLTGEYDNGMTAAT
tara:strand:+ start:1868 stop:1993 length:126 start_codon:yes stop_codon:yes gene_type:complete